MLCCPLQWRHNDRDDVSNHQPHDCCLTVYSRRRSKKTPKLRVTGLCAGNSPVTGEFPAQRASNAKNVSIWWHHQVFDKKSWHAYFLSTGQKNKYLIFLPNCRSRNICHFFSGMSMPYMPCAQNRLPDAHPREKSIAAFLVSLRSGLCSALIILVLYIILCQNFRTCGNWTLFVYPISTDKI